MIWFDYPGFENNVRFNKDGKFQRFISGKWKYLNPSINKGRNVMTFSTTIKMEKLYCVVPKFVWEFFNKPIPEGYDVSYKDNDPNNCNLNNLEIKHIGHIRDKENRKSQEELLYSIPSSFIIKEIQWDWETKTRPSKKGGVDTIQYTIDYSPTKVLLYHPIEKIGGWVSYRTVRNYDDESKLDMFKSDNLFPFPEGFNENRVFKTEDGYPDLYLDTNRKIFSITETCLKYKSYTDYQLSLTHTDDWTKKLSISPNVIIESIEGVDPREDRTKWTKEYEDKFFLDLVNIQGYTPEYGQLSSINYAFKINIDRQGGKNYYYDLCKKHNLDVIVAYFDEDGKNFDSYDEFRIFCLLRHNNLKFERQSLYPDNSSRTLDFKIFDLCRLEFTGRVNENAVERLDQKEKDAKLFGWDDFKVMDYVSHEPPDKFTERLSNILGIDLLEPNWNYFHTKYGYGLDKIKVKIKDFLLENYPKVSQQNELLKIDWHLMTWAKRLWGEFFSVLLENDIEIKHKTRITPKYLKENYKSLIQWVIKKEGFLPQYSQTLKESKYNKILSYQTKIIVRSLYYVFRDDFCKPSGILFEEYKTDMKFNFTKIDWTWELINKIKKLSKTLSQEKIAKELRKEGIPINSQKQVGSVLHGWVPKVLQEN